MAHRCYLLGLLTLTAIAPGAHADLIRVTDNHGALVAFCDGGCDISVAGPSGASSLLLDSPQFLIADPERPLIVRDFIHVEGFGGSANSYQVHFFGSTTSTFSCLELSDVHGCGFSSSDPFSYHLDYFSSLTSPALSLYRLDLVYSPDPGTLVLLGAPLIGLALRRRFKSSQIQ